MNRPEMNYEELMAKFGGAYVVEHCRLPVVTLCGSSKLKTMFEKLQFKLTTLGFVVHALPIYSSHDKVILTDEVLDKLIYMHKYLIKKSDLVVVITENGLIGKHAAAEIAVAHNNNIPVRYFFAKNTYSGGQR